MNYREYPPGPRLSGYVECYWTLDARLDGIVQPDRVIPDGRPELIWNLADPFRRHLPDGGAVKVQPAALLVGQITAPFRLAPAHDVALVAVRFRPAALGPFLRGISADELADCDVALDDVVGTRLADLGARLAETPAARRVAVLEQSLAADLQRGTPVDAGVCAAVDAIVASRGRIRIEALAARLGIGRRTLERRFRSEVGIPPKTLARIIRFRHLLTRIDRVGPAGWSGLAVTCGYFDQAHLIRDFRDFAACTPREYLAATFPFGGVFLEAADA